MLVAATWSQLLAASSPPPQKAPNLFVPGERQVLVFTCPPMSKDRDIRHAKQCQNVADTVQSTHAGTSKTLRGSTKTSHACMCLEWEIKRANISFPFSNALATRMAIRVSREIDSEPTNLVHLLPSFRGQTCYFSWSNSSSLAPSSDMRSPMTSPPLGARR